MSSKLKETEKDQFWNRHLNLFVIKGCLDVCNSVFFESFHTYFLQHAHQTAKAFRRLTEIIILRTFRKVTQRKLNIYIVALRSDWNFYNWRNLFIKCCTISRDFQDFGRQFFLAGYLQPRSRVKAKESDYSYTRSLQVKCTRHKGENIINSEVECPSCYLQIRFKLGINKFFSVPYSGQKKNIREAMSMDKYPRGVTPLYGLYRYVRAP